MALGDVYEITLAGVDGVGTPLGFSAHYRFDSLASGLPNAQNALTAFDLSILALMHPFMTDDKQWLTADAVNLDDPADTFQSGGFPSGSLTNPPLPPFVAIGFRSPKQGRGFNRSRHNLPLGDISWCGQDYQMIQTNFDDLYFLQQAFGLPIVRPATEATLTPVTIRKNYVDSVFVGYDIRSVVTGQWSVTKRWTSQVSRNTPIWEVAVEPA